MVKYLQLKAHILLLLPFFSFFGITVYGQTVLIDPTLEGGFELGSTFAANGWSVSNSVNNPWVIGTAISTPPIAGNSAYVSNDLGTTNNYTNTTIALNYFWRDITVPAGQTVIKLSLDWIQTGESTWDAWQVFAAPTSITPTSTTTYPGSGLAVVPSGIAGATFVGSGSVTTGVQSSTLFLPSNLAGTTFRLIFAWKNDGSGGSSPAATLDNISLTSRIPGTFISVTTGNWTTPSTWQANAVPSPADSVIISTPDIVTINATGQGAKDLIINGLLEFGTTPTTFDVMNNLTVNTGGVFNVFNGTTGKAINVRGNILLDGSIDLSIGATTTGSLTLSGTTVQSVTGSGSFGATNVIRNIVCSNTNTATPNIIWGIDNVKVAYNLNLTGARVNLGTNKLTFGNNAAGNSLTAPAGTGFLPGAKFSRFWSATANGSTITAGTVPTSTLGLYPFVTSTNQNRSAFLRRTNLTGAAAGEIAVVYNHATTMTSGLSYNDAGYNVVTQYDGNWTFSDEGTAINSSSYILALIGQTAYTVANGNSRIINSGGILPGSVHQNGTNLPSAQRNTIQQADLFSSPLYLAVASVDYTPATPGTLTQSPGVPSCVTGTQITASGSPETDVIWYWQTSATGTSTTTPYSGPYTVNANGTYYLRAYNNVSLIWSANASTIVISNFTPAAAPLAPTADANPSCLPTGTTLTAATAPANTAYFWQGTVNGGSSTALPATTPYNTTTSGTYYLAAYDSTSLCWSNTVGIAVTVDAIIPFDPVVTADVLNLCNGDLTGIVNASVISMVPGTITTTTAGGNGCGGGAMFNITSNAQPITITSIEAVSNSTSAQNVNVYYKAGTYVGSETNAGAWTLIGTYPINFTAGTLATIDIADLAIPVNATTAFFVNYSAQYTSLATTYTNADLTITTGAGLCSAFGGVNNGRTFNGKINYNVGIPSSLAWFDASNGGNNLGTGSPFETVGTTLLPNTLTNGSYTFFVAGQSGGCYSVNRDSVVVNVTPVNYPVIPIDASCNGNNNGSFSLGTTGCGVAPFEYSVNGAPFTPVIPNDLVAGNYTVIIRDANMDSSAVIPFVIGQPSAPQGLATTTINYFSADVTWTPQGDETSWTVEYGPAGFTPGTGTIITATTNTATLTNLSANTSYDFYVTADCGTNSAPAGPLTFATDPGFLAWDNSCPPSGFVDISTTGTLNNLTDDAEVGVTMPFNFNYQGVSYNTMTIGNNGGIVFGTLTAQIGFGNAAMSTLATPGLYPFWDDMGGNGAGVFYQTIGTAPNQQFIVQWNREHLSAGGNQLVYQLILDQATNDIYFVYNDVIAGNATYNYGASATIGVSGVTDIDVSLNNATYLTNNSCVHFYNALCPNVTNFTSVVSQNDAVLDWNPGLYGETAWTLVYGLAGFDPTNTAEVINTFNLTSSDASFGNTLDQLTEYDVYIYSECAADNLTSNGFFFNFTTLPYCSNPASITANTDVDSLEASWNWTASSIDYPILSYNIQYGPSGFNLYDGTIVAANGTNLADTIFDASFMGGGVYQVYVQAVCTDVVNGGIDTSAFSGPITFIMPLTTDTVCGAELLTVDGTVYTFNNTGATVSFDESNIAPPTTGTQTTDGWANSTLNNTTWYKFIAPASGSVRVNATANTYNGQIGVYDVTNCADFNTNFDLIAANDDEIGGAGLAPNFTVCGLTPGNEYYIMHDGFNSTTGNHTISITEIVLEAGTTNPLTQICTGDDVNLFTTINGYDMGGAWSAPVAAVNASITDSTFTSTGLAYQTFTFQYRVTDGCAYDSITSQVQVFAPSSAGTDGTLTVCKNETVDLLSGLGGVYDANGTWYDPSNVAMASSQITATAFPGSFNYDYIAGNGVCPDDTANVVVVVLSTCDINSIDETVFAGVSVYPNPSTGIIYVDADLAAGNFDYEVTDAKGRIVAKAKNAIKAASTSTIDLRGVETGVYFIRLSNQSSDKMFRIVVQ